MGRGRSLGSEEGRERKDKVIQESRDLCSEIVGSDPALGWEQPSFDGCSMCTRKFLVGQLSTGNSTNFPSAGARLEPTELHIDNCRSSQLE